VSIRRTLAAVAAVSLALTTAACGSSSNSSPSSSDSAGGASSTSLTGQTFTFAGFGGALQANQDKAWFTPFSRENGVKVVQTDNTGTAALQTQIQSGNIQWDVVEEAQFQADTGCGTLYDKIPDVDRSQIDPKYLTNDCGVPIVKFSFVLAYNSKKYSTPPTSIGDIMNTKAFPGKRGMSDAAVNGPIEAAQLGSGVAADKLYPLDYQKAITQLGTIKSDIVFFKTFAEEQDALASGNIDMALIPNGRAYNASVTNPDIKVAWGSALTLFDNALLVKGAPNATAAKAFLNYVAKPDTQIALSTIFPYGVLTKGGTPTMPGALQPFFPDDPANASQLLYQDQKWWSQNQDAVNQAWTAFISG